MFTTAANRWTPLIIALVAACATATHLTAQEVLIEDPANVEAPGQQIAPTRSEIIENLFDRIIFSGVSSQAIAPILERMADSRIDLAARKCTITSDDRLKLKTAARGDIKRFLDLVAEQKEAILRDTTIGDGEIRIIALKSGILLREEMEHILDDQSFFAKTWHRIEARPANKERSRRRYRQAVAYVTLGLQKSLELRDDQRDELIDLVMTETRPLNRHGELDSYAVLVQVAELPDNLLQTILDETQRRKLREMSAPATAARSRLIDEQYLDTDLSPAGETENRGHLRMLNQMLTRPAKVQP